MRALLTASIGCLEVQFTKEDLLVSPSTANDGFQRVEVHFRHSSLVPGKFVQAPGSLRVPHTHKSVRRPSRDVAAVRAPGALEQQLLKVVLEAMARVFQAPAPTNVRVYVPDFERVVHGVGQQLLAVWRQGNAGDGIFVPFQLVNFFAFVDVPAPNDVVDASCEELGGVVAKAHACDLVVGGKSADGILHSEIPQQSLAIVTPCARQGIAPASDADAVHNAFVPPKPF
mmetsp:Transcript_19152/g.26890  ORF Transcript_19152/g.26890 Transcript_19152/m.26890 type:complete len:228 (+) Transcript_19152:155-838(+)